ncbi:hypothetical protein ACLMJK_003652 [Lecanora helva]
MASKAPDNFSTLCAFEWPDLEDQDVLQFDTRREKWGPNGELIYPTPSGNGIWKNPRAKKRRDAFIHRAVDLVRLSFLPGQTDHFRHDLYPEDFEPTRNQISINWNNWRKDIVMHEEFMSQPAHIIDVHIPVFPNASLD